MAKRITSPQSGAFAGRDRQAEDAHRATGRPRRPDRPRRGEDQGHPDRLERGDRPGARRRLATPTSTEPAAQASAASSTIGNTAGANAPASGDERAEHRDLAGSGAAPAWPPSVAKGASPPARASRAAMNGKAAYATSPSQRPVPRAA